MRPRSADTGRLQSWQFVGKPPAPGTARTPQHMCTSIWRRPLLYASASLLIIVGIGVPTVALYAGASLPDATEAMTTDARVQVDASRWLLFRPLPRPPGSTRLGPPGTPTGFIFYPGGGVDPVAYAPLARAIAGAGHPVIIVPVTLRLAFFNIDAASPVFAMFPEIKRWAIGGHSLGGVAASWYARANPDRISGLILWAAYTDADHSLAAATIPVLSISGTLDGNVTPAKIIAGRLLLPVSTRYLAIEGGNHNQFGSYRFQANDGTPTISRTEQQRQVVDATVAFLDTLGAP